jgi:hypothetical protein
MFISTSHSLLCALKFPLLIRVFIFTILFAAESRSLAPILAPTQLLTDKYKYNTTYIYRSWALLLLCQGNTGIPLAKLAIHIPQLMTNNVPTTFVMNTNIPIQYLRRNCVRSCMYRIAASKYCDNNAATPTRAGRTMLLKM